MANTDTSDKQQHLVEDVSEEMFSSEKREDTWALIIAFGILVLSVAFPAQIYDFFRNSLYLF